MRYYLDAYGCTMNFGEGYALSRRLERAGHRRVGSAEEADTVLLVSCIVIQATENRMWRLIRKYRQIGKHVLICGCLPSISGRELEGTPGITVLRIRDYRDLEKVVPKARGVRNSIPMEGVTHIIPIAQGCLGRCAYCITRIARGRLKTPEPEALVREAEEAIANGVKEIYLSAQDTAVFGLDVGNDIAWLVSRVSRIPGDFRIRVGMMSPAFAYNIKDKILKMYAEPKVYKFLHLPVQSGSDKMLKLMNRGHAVGEFVDLVRGFRRRYDKDDSMLSTDIIVAFPQETDEDFERSLRLIEECEPDIVNVTRYSPRPGTPAFRFDGVPHGRVAKARSREMAKLRFGIGRRRNERLIGRTLSALVTERGRGAWICRTDSYRPVVVKGRLELGDRIKVRVTSASEIYLVGRYFKS
jgi:MiaB-like tRNA modifying enzyme